MSGNNIETCASSVPIDAKEKRLLWPLWLQKKPNSCLIYAQKLSLSWDSETSAWVGLYFGVHLICWGPLSDVNVTVVVYEMRTGLIMVVDAVSGEHPKARFANPSVSDPTYMSIRRAGETGTQVFRDPPKAGPNRADSSTPPPLPQRSSGTNQTPPGEIRCVWGILHGHCIKHYQQ